MTIRRVFYNLFSDDLPRARDFYVGLFGFRVAFDSNWFVQLTVDGREQLELGILRRGHELVGASPGAPVGGMLTLVVDDVDVLVAQAEARSVVILEQPRNLFYGQRRALLKDPDGLLLDVSSECPPDPEWMKRVRQRDDGAYVEG